MHLRGLLVSLSLLLLSCVSATFLLLALSFVFSASFLCLFCFLLASFCLPLAQRFGVWCFCLQASDFPKEGRFGSFFRRPPTCLLLLQYTMASNRVNPVEHEEEEEEALIINTGNTGFSEKRRKDCLVGRVWTGRAVNAFGLMDTMKKVWNLRRGMTCREIETNLFSFQFNNQKDAERVLNGTPWHFNKDSLVLKPIEENIPPSAMQFNLTPIWIRLYDGPLLARSKTVVQQMGNRVGRFVEVDEETIHGLSQSIRLRVEIDLNKPLKTGMKICIDNKNVWIQIKYERLPSFCYICGHLGHTMKDCDQAEEIQPSQSLKFGDFLRASPKKMGKMLVDQGRTPANGAPRMLLPHNRVNHERKEEEEDEQAVHIIPTEIISKLLNSLEQVGVHDNQTISANTIGEAIYPNPLP